MIWPGVQKPHWKASISTKARWTGSSSPPLAGGMDGSLLGRAGGVAAGCSGRRRFRARGSAQPGPLAPLAQELAGRLGGRALVAAEQPEDLGGRPAVEQVVGELQATLGG